MSFTVPLSHKCPVCQKDLYSMHKEKLFLSIFNRKEIQCNSCGSILQWKISPSNYLFRYLLIGGLFLAIASSVFGVIIEIQRLEYLSIISAACFLVLSGIVMFFLRIEQVKLG